MARLRAFKINPTSLMGFRLVGLALIFSLLTTGIVFSSGDHDRAKALRERGDIRPLDEILEKARKNFGGKMIEVELEEEHGKIIYELEFIRKNGVVLELKYDAKTGKLLKIKKEHGD